MGGHRDGSFVISRKDKGKTRGRFFYHTTMTKEPSLCLCWYLKRAKDRGPTSRPDEPPVTFLEALMAADG